MGARRLYAGVDGGATKTWAVVGDATGCLQGFGASGGANYHVYGMELTMRSVTAAVSGALTAAGATPADIARAAFYLAGDDSKEDHANLGAALLQSFPDVVLDWDNDCWAALRGGTDKGWGAVVIGGSGTNSAARAPDGRRAILRGLGRDTGNPGGSSDIAREAVYWAFRMDEKMIPATPLHGEILRVLGLPDYDAVVRESLASGLAFSFQAMGAITPLVFRLADEGDPKAQEILIEVGRLMGEQTGAAVRRAGIERLEFDLVLAGSIYRGQSPLLIDALALAVHRSAPKAKPRLPVYEPVVGAYLLALEGAGLAVGPETYANVDRSLPGLLPEAGPLAVGGVE